MKTAIHSSAILLLALFLSACPSNGTETSSPAPVNDTASNETRSNNNTSNATDNPTLDATIAPDALPCKADNECQSGTCSLGKCVAKISAIVPIVEGKCATFKDCTEPNSYCDPKTNTCVACVSGTLPFALPDKCVQCLTKANCSYLGNGKNTCLNNECVECIDDASCPAGKSCKDNACIPQNQNTDECKTALDCDNPDATCVVGADGFGYCKTCPATTPVALKTINKCVECGIDAQCSTGKTCKGNSCVTPDPNPSECKTAQDCTNPNATCTPGTNGAFLCTPCPTATPIASKPDNKCVECMNGSLCTNGKLCKDNSCPTANPTPDECKTALECPKSNAICAIDSKGGRHCRVCQKANPVAFKEHNECVECSLDAHCSDGKACKKNVCVAKESEPTLKKGLCKTVADCSGPSEICTPAPGIGDFNSCKKCSGETPVVLNNKCVAKNPEPSLKKGWCNTVADCTDPSEICTPALAGNGINYCKKCPTETPVALKTENKCVQCQKKEDCSVDQSCANSVCVKTTEIMAIPQKNSQSLYEYPCNKAACLNYKMAAGATQIVGVDYWKKNFIFKATKSCDTKMIDLSECTKACAATDDTINKTGEEIKLCKFNCIKTIEQKVDRVMSGVSIKVPYHIADIAPICGDLPTNTNLDGGEVSDTLSFNQQYIGFAAYLSCNSNTFPKIGLLVAGSAENIWHDKINFSNNKNLYSEITIGNKSACVLASPQMAFCPSGSILTGFLIGRDDYGLTAIQGTCTALIGNGMHL